MEEPRPPAEEQPEAARVARAQHQGREAFYAGEPWSACPYPDEGPERSAWLATWQATLRFREYLDEYLERQA